MYLNGQAWTFPRVRAMTEAEEIEAMLPSITYFGLFAS